MQEGKVVSYASRQLRKHEKNYPTHNLELATVVHALKNMETLSHRSSMWDIQWSQEPQIHLHSDGSKLRQWRWLELIKDCDLGINYHPDKANVIADALSHKKYCNATFARRMRPKLRREIKYLNLTVVNDATVTMEVESTLEAEIWERQLEDTKLQEIWQLIRDNKTSDFSEDNQCTLWLGKWMCS
jgi:hypothetical protein